MKEEEALAVTKTVELEYMPVSPMELISRAAQQGASVEMMRELFALKQQVEADEARKAFHAAFTGFKAETIRVVRDKENTQYSKPGKPAMYTSLENMVATVTPFLSKHGLSAAWEVKQNGVIAVTCAVTHTLGHSKSVTMEAPADASGAKNALQQIKSTVTYLKVSTFEAACGLASAYGNLDDDGNGSGAATQKAGVMPEDQLVIALDAINGCTTVDTVVKTFQAWYKEAQNANDKNAMDQLLECKNKRKAEVSK